MQWVLMDQHPQTDLKIISKSGADLIDDHDHHNSCQPSHPTNTTFIKEEY